MLRRILQEYGDFTWRVYDWKNYWGLLTGDDGVGLLSYTIRRKNEGDYCGWVTSKRGFDVPDVLDVQEIPSEEVRMVPESPTVTKNPIL